MGSEEIAKGRGVLEELWEAAPTERFLNCTDEQVLRDWRSPAACEYGPGDAKELEYAPASGETTAQLEFNFHP